MASTGGKQHFIRSVIDKHPELKDQTAKFALPVLNQESKKQNMGFEITAADFGNYRTELKKKGDDKPEPATIEAAVAANHKPAAAPAAKKAAPAAAAAADPVAAAKAVKALVSQFGVETVKGLADLFSK